MSSSSEQTHDPPPFPVIPYYASPQLVGSREDRRYLRWIANAHYVCGGVVLAFAVIAMASMLLAGGLWWGGLMGIAGALWSCLTLFSARCIARRRRRSFSIAWSVLNAWLAVLLAIWISFHFLRAPTPASLLIGAVVLLMLSCASGSIIVLCRPSVREIYVELRSPAMQ